MRGQPRPREVWKLDMIKELGVFPCGSKMALCHFCSIASYRDLIYVSELENVEDRLLHAMERATLHLQPEEVHALLRRHLPAARAAHERIRTLKCELTAKAAA